MTPEFIVQLAQKTLELTIVLMLLLLLPALVVGVLVSMFQAATQINEMTLSFIPKLLVTMLVLVLAGPMMIRLITDFTHRLFDTIPTVLG